jgi:hypothetical protein
MKSKVKRRNYGLWLLRCSFLLLLLFPVLDWESVQGAISPDHVNRRATNREKFFCADKDVETLTTHLLQDLPSYANRAIQRARPPLLSKMPDFYSYVIIAGKPEFTPLPLTTYQSSLNAKQNASEGVKQVFFSTLERMYTSGKAVYLEEFHWLFLTKTRSGWRMVMMFSQTGDYPPTKPPTPPQDTSDGDIAQGINAWLRDCQAGK